ncbi:Thioesterase/thiol ester dehydrase-isomerase [Auriscalpium vulgare]|uniref:Thioesterase/thiol ester dehydrase-isomerase n=1 Tax=Auriscalpium vulgare TaxID=40419 RepID=A0ACB8S056_9AGAM|nr:Thioesterase/thiol ester dehydrase-isomerase [Auriscalpium vulgare]
MLAARASHRRLLSASVSSKTVLARHFSPQADASAAHGGKDAREVVEDVDELDTLLKNIRKHTSPTGHHFVPVRGYIPWAQTLLDQSRGTSTEPPPSPATTAPPLRSMLDSYTEILLPFASSPELYEQYANAAGGIRTGKLFEHLDSLAGSIAYKHVLGPDVQTLGLVKELGFYIVTASVDRLDMLAPLSPVRDLRLSGHVIHVGKSSMEVAVKMEALEKTGTEKTLMLGRFSMVCRNAFTHKAHPVNQLSITTSEEEALHRLGALHRRRQKSQAMRSLTLVPPSSDEAQVLHDYSLRYGDEHYSNSTGEERVWMDKTKLERTMLMFPQERNVHQKIFGGYLMRLAYELGFTTARLFSRQRVRFLSLDKISFARPVPIGSILRLTSEILHTTSSEQFPSIVHVRVKANVVDVEKGTEEMTNDFRFTWCTDEGTPMARRVVPRTYRDAMLWLEGRRALEMGAAIQGLRNS